MWGVGGRGDIFQSRSRFVVRFPVGIFCSVAFFCSWRSSHLLGDMKGNLLLGYVWWQLNGIGQVGGTFMCKPSLQIGISFFLLYQTPSVRLVKIATPLDWHFVSTDISECDQTGICPEAGATRAEANIIDFCWSWWEHIATTTSAVIDKKRSCLRI